MKKTLKISIAPLIFAVLFTVGHHLFRPTDDTATVQAAVSTGSIAKGTYTVTSTITVNHSFNGNGSTINYTGTGKCFNITAANVKVQKWNLVGASDATNSSTGVVGIQIGVFDHDTISFCHVSTFTAYGILGTNGNTPVISDCNISDTGYIGLYYANSATTTGGELARDTIDRSMISASQGPGVTQGALMLRGGASTPASYWYVHDCLLTQSSNPADLTAMCCESRYTPYARFDHITCTNGSIGISLVNSPTPQIANSSFTGQNSEGVEFGNSPNGSANSCSIGSQLHDGILFDGGTTSDTLYNVSVNGCNRYSAYLIQSSNSIVFNYCNFTSTSANPSIELAVAYGLTMHNTNLLGSSTGNYAFELNNSTGNISATGGMISHFTSKLFHYTTGTSAIADNINLRGMSYTSMTLSQDVFGSYTLGSNINYNLAGQNSIPVSGSGSRIIMKIHH